MVLEIPRGRTRPFGQAARNVAIESEPAPVTEPHLRAALAERLGVPAETIMRRVDWIRVLVEAVPFQEEAAGELGRALRTAQTLRGFIAGTALAINNARDWGEQEMIKAVAERGYGDPQAVCRLDLRPFSSDDAVGVLLQAAMGNSEIAEGISLLSRVLQARRSGLLVFENFDNAHPIVQQVLLDGVRSGHVLDYRGRDLATRAFTTVFLLNEDPPRRRLGFQSTSQTPAERAEFLTRALDAAVCLVAPNEAAASVALAQAVYDFEQETGLDVELSACAEEFLSKLLVRDGLSAYRERVKRHLVEAVAEGLERRNLKIRRFKIALESQHLTALARRCQGTETGYQGGRTTRDD